MTNDIDQLLIQTQELEENQDFAKLAKTYREIAKIYHKKKDRKKCVKYNKLSRKARAKVPKKEPQINVSQKVDNTNDGIIRQLDDDGFSLVTYGDENNEKELVILEEDFFESDIVPDLEKIKLLKKELRNNPKNTDKIYHSIGDIYSEIGEPEKAIEYYNLYLEANSSDDKEIIAHTYANCAILYVKLEDYDSAKKYLEEAMAQHYNCEIIIDYAKLLHSHFSDIKTAKMYYEKAIKFEPNNAYVCFSYALFCLLSLKKTRKAIKLFKKAVELEPNSAEYNFSYARVLDTKTFFRIIKAIDYYESAILLAPTNSNYHYYFANYLLLFRKEYQRAKQIAERAIELDQNDAEYYLLYAKILEKLNEHDSVILSYENAIRLSLKDTISVTYFSYAEYLESQKEYEKAKESYMYATVSNPENYWYNRTYRRFLKRHFPEELKK